MIPSRNTLEAVEIEGLLSLVNTDVKSGVQTRWERKQQEREMSSPSKSFMSTPKKSSTSEFNCSPSKTPNFSRASKENSAKAAGVNGARRRCGGVSSSALGTRSLNCATPSGTDRFIPSRSAIDFETASYKTNISTKFGTDETETKLPVASNSQEFQRTLQTTLGVESDSRILAFKKKAPAPVRNATDDNFENPLTVLYSQQSRRNFSLQNASSAPTRHIPSQSTRILDAPDLLDDFYINPLDWSCSNILGVALGPTVYLWNAQSGSISQLMEMEGAAENGLDHISSLKFIQDGGNHLAIGTSDKGIQIWDVERQKKLRTMTGHSSRVSSLSWNKHILTSGGRDSTIFHHDVRVASHIITTLQEGHCAEVCQVKWSDDGVTLATGGNDNTVCLWDARAGQEFSDKPRLRLTQHQAAVKAMAWCPYQRNVLATGGGTSDRTIKIWNTVNGKCEQSINTGSQVCSLVFNPHDKELLSSHGFSNCELSLWKFPTMTKIKDLSGHTQRVLHTAMNPEGTTVCSAAADETLRFWDVFQPITKKKETGSREGVLKLQLR